MVRSVDWGAWPKTRGELPEAYQRIYSAHMETNRSGGTPLNRAALWLEQWMHRQVARPPASRILELGGGGLNHLGFEPREARYDVVEPLAEIIEPAIAIAPKPVDYLGDYESFIAQAASPPVEYDKVVSVAVLEHLEALPAVVAASALHLAPRGIFAAGIPSEGGLLWKLGWRTTTARAFTRDYGLDYGRLMAWEHINTAREIEGVITALFEIVSVTRFPGPTIDTSVYSTIFARNPRVDLCRSVLDRRL